MLAASLLLCFFLLRRLPSAALSLVRPNRRLVFDVLRQPGVLPLYLVVFCLFFTFAAVMNFLPFRLTELHQGVNELRIGLMYSGYAMGIVSSLGAVRVGRLLGDERRAMALGLAGVFVGAAAGDGVGAGMSGEDEGYGAVGRVTNARPRNVGCGRRLRPVENRLSA